METAVDLKTENANLVENLVDTALESEGQPDDENSPPEESNDGASDDQSEAQPGAEEDKQVDPAKPKPAEGQDQVVESAIAALEKELGRKDLKDDEIVREFGKSYLNAGPKIQDLSSQVKELVPYVEAFEQAMSKIEELTAIIQTHESGGEAGDPNSREAQLQTRIERMEQAQRRREAEEQQRIMSVKAGDFKSAFDELGKDEELDGSGFSELRQEYLKSQSLNPYAPMPQKLALLVSISESISRANPGMKTLDVVKQAWKAANSDRLEDNWKRKLAKDQERKRKLPSLARKGAIPKAAPDTRGQSIEEIVKGIVDANLSG